MRKLVLSVVFVLGFAIQASAQQIPADPEPLGPFNGGRGQFPGCPDCGVLSYVDLPKDESTVSASNLVFQGWGFECVSGRPANRVDVWYQDYDGYWKSLPQPSYVLYFGIVSRPDVRNAFVGSCPNVDQFSGWYLNITNPPPSGLRRIKISVWYGPYFQSHSRTYLVKD
jgi:hypothetical protein